MKTNTVECLECGHKFTSTSFGCDKPDKDISFFACCPLCGSSFDISEEEALFCLIPRLTKVKFLDGTIGIIDGCDFNGYESVDESDIGEGSDFIFNNINYYICPIEFEDEEFWSVLK